MSSFSSLSFPPMQYTSAFQQLHEKPKPSHLLLRLGMLSLPQLVPHLTGVDVLVLRPRFTISRLFAPVVVLRS